ncbi:MAG: hypothetical protein HN337_08940 [Deltaproteobacteria bacterium]|jgi:hypothetical protein|nr:hypothetical protein [Deltaproteobacteria bacterium]
MGGPPKGITAKPKVPVKCEGVTHLNVTQKLLDEYPGLVELGFKKGDKIVTGKPFDTIVRSDKFKMKGKCDSSCTAFRPTVDATKGFGWETEFISKYFPHELGTLESLQKSTPAKQCYKDPLADHLMRAYAEAISSMEDASRSDYEILEKLEKGTATSKDLKTVKKHLKTRIKTLRTQKQDTKSLELGLKLVKLRLTQSKTLMSKK